MKPVLGLGSAGGPGVEFTKNLEVNYVLEEKE